MSATGSWQCLDEDARPGLLSLSISWCQSGSFFVIAYADLNLNLAVQTLNADGSNDSVPMQLLPLGYVISTLHTVDTPYGVAVAWSQNGQVNYALVSSDGILRHSSALAVNVSQESGLGGIGVKLRLSWNGAGLTAAGMSTSAAGGSTQGTGYLFARSLPVAADVALGMPQFSPADFSSSPVTVSVPIGNLGVVPFSGVDVSVKFELVSASGAVTSLGSVPAPAQLASGELANVSFAWTVASGACCAASPFHVSHMFGTGAAGVVRVSLSGNRDVNASNDVITALPTLLKWTLDAVELNTPGTITSLLAPVKVVGPGAASVQVQLWSTSTDNNPDNAVYVRHSSCPCQTLYICSSSFIDFDLQLRRLGAAVGAVRAEPHAAHCALSCTAGARWRIRPPRNHMARHHPADRVCIAHSDWMHVSDTLPLPTGTHLSQTRTTTLRSTACTLRSSALTTRTCASVSRCSIGAFCRLSAYLSQPPSSTRTVARGCSRRCSLPMCLLVATFRR